MSINATFPCRNMRKSRNRASALLIVLAAIVLVSTIVLAFYIQASLSRQISFSSSAQQRAEKISTVAFDTIIGDLQAEIIAGSSKNTVGTNTVYTPNTNFTVVPYRVGDQNFPNLVKKSVSDTKFWTKVGTNYTKDGPVRAVAPASSTSASSANGRKVDINRWNASYLLGDTLPATFTAPDWILVTRGGVSASSVPGSYAVMADSSTNNAGYVVGRFAYAIFDEGGLLDVNVAGFPNGVSSNYVAKRGLLPQVDLANIPGFTQTSANDLVKWRNLNSSIVADNYVATVYSSTNGFATVANGDQTFVSRKDLIAYVKKSGTIPTSTLQYLGTFSRELNAPTFTPDPNRKKVVNGSFNPNTFGKDNDFNPSLINTRVTKPFTRVSDGTTAIIGESLLKYRFPLSRLNWIGRKGVQGATEKQVEDAFGLTYSGGVWTYTQAISGQIMNLAQVAAAEREPNFFELLQAAIHVGSLAKGAPFELNRQPLSPSNPDLNPWYQIIQIGANIIDQYDGDSFPTRINFNGKIFVGIESLPYLSRVAETPYRLPSGDVAMWYLPEVWNPESRAGSPGPTPTPMPTPTPSATATPTPSPTPSTGGPTDFRFITSGRAYAIFYADAAPTVIRASDPPNDFQNPTGLTFSTSSGNTFSQPVFLSAAVGASAVGNDVIPNSGGYVGIFIGQASGVTGMDEAVAIPSPLVSHRLEYMDNGQWITYSEITEVNQGLSVQDGGSFNGFLPRRCFVLRVDPRVDRFGVVGSADGGPELIRADAGEGVTAHVKLGGSYQGWTLGAVSPSITGAKAMGSLSENKSASTTRYTDPDSVQRRADGAYTVGSGLDGLPMAKNSTASRPVVLNRPFRTVGELGYASRGAPWKALDFFTAESGDSALLDVFCINESPNPPYVAGRIDLNTRQIPVLSAILEGAIVSEVDGSTISKADATTLATSLVNRTSASSGTNGPLLNRNELVTKWAQDLVYSSSQNTIIKARREAAIRGLADVGMTRTWNLLIDVIAQTGRYQATASNLNQFIVEGERRFWMHIALDRFTGKVISSSIEPVYE